MARHAGVIMRAADIMIRPVVSAHRDTTIRDAIVLLTENRLAALPVIDDDDRILGIVSEADLLDGIRGAAAGRVNPSTAIGQVMTAPVVVMPPSADVRAVAERMLSRELRSMPIADGDVLVGMVSLGDLLRTLVHDDGDIASKVSQLLLDYAGWRRRWQITVRGGVVTVAGRFTDDSERRIVAGLCLTVPGVVRVDLSAAPAAEAAPG